MKNGNEIIYNIDYKKNYEKKINIKNSNPKKNEKYNNKKNYDEINSENNEKISNQDNLFDKLNELKMISFDTSKNINFYQNKKLNLKENSNNSQKNKCKKNDKEVNEYNEQFLNEEKNIPDNQKNRENIYKKMHEKIEVTNFFFKEKNSEEEQNKNSKVYTNINKKNNNLNFKNALIQNYNFSNFSENKLNSCEIFLKNSSNNENYIIHNKNDVTKNKMSSLNNKNNIYKNHFEDENEVDAWNLQMKNINTLEINKDNSYERNNDKIYLKPNDIEENCVNNDNFCNYSFLNNENRAYNIKKNDVMVYSKSMENENILNKTKEASIINKNGSNKKVVDSNNYVIVKSEEKNNANYSHENFVINNFNIPKNYFLNNKKSCDNNNNEYVENDKNSYNNFIFYKNEVCNDKIENNFIDKDKIGNKNADYNESNNITIPYNNVMDSNKVNKLNKNNIICNVMDHLTAGNSDNNSKQFFFKNDKVNKEDYSAQENNNGIFIKTNLMNSISTVDNLILMNCNNTEYNDISNNHLIKYNNIANDYNDNNIYSTYDTFISPNYNFNNNSDTNMNNLFINNDSMNNLSYVPSDNNCYVRNNCGNNIFMDNSSSMKNDHCINYNKNYTSNNNNYVNDKSINNVKNDKNGCANVNSMNNLKYIDDKKEENLKVDISFKKDNEYKENKFPSFIREDDSYEKKCYNTFSKNYVIGKNNEFVDNNYNSSIKNNKEQNISFNNINYNNYINNNYIESNEMRLKKNENDANILNEEKEKIDRSCDILHNEETRIINNGELNNNKNIEVALKNENINNSFKSFTNDNKAIKHISNNEKSNSKYVEILNQGMDDNYCLNNLRSDEVKNIFNNLDIQYVNYENKRENELKGINNNTQSSLEEKEHFVNEFQKNERKEENMKELVGNRGYLYEEIENFNNSESLHNLKNKDINNSFELSLFDNTNELNNKYEDLFEKKMIYNLYLQSLLTNINNSYKNESSAPINDGNVKPEGDNRLVLFNLNNMQNKILNKFPRINNYFSYLDYYIESLRLLYDKLLSNRNLILKLAKEIFSKNINEKKIYSSLDERHSYFRELLSMLLPQPPIVPSLEFWLYMDKKNASQIHKLHLTLYIIYQKIIYNFSNILLQINNDINYSNKNKSTKNNATDSLNYYVDDKHEKHPSIFKSSLNNDYISKDNAEVEKDITFKNPIINELKSNNTTRGVLVSSDNNKIMKYNDINTNYKNNNIEKKCLFEINKKLENIMTSINNITNMINIKKETKLDNKRDISCVDEIIDDQKRRSIETIDDNLELSNNKLSEYEYENDRNILPEFRKENYMEPICNVNETKGNKTVYNQIVAYDDLKKDELFENLSNIKLDKNNSFFDENPLKLLDKIKYELSDVYDEIFNLKKYDNFAAISDQSTDFSGLCNSMNDGTLTKSKHENSHFNGFLDDENLNYSQLNNSSNSSHNFSNNKSINKENFNKRNKFIDDVKNTNLCSNENINDIIYDINCTDDIFKRLIFLSKSYYNNLSECDNYLINAYKENEKKFKNFNEIKNSNNIDEVLHNQLVPTNEQNNNISVNNNYINISNYGDSKNFISNMDNTHICDTNREINIYNEEKENDNLNRLNENSFIFIKNDESNSINNNNDMKKKNNYINMNISSFKNSYDDMSLDNQNDFRENSNSLIKNDKNYIILNEKKQFFLSDDVLKNKNINPLNKTIFGYNKNNEFVNYNNDNNTNNNSIIKHRNSNDFNNNINIISIAKEFNEDNYNSNKLSGNKDNYNSNNSNEENVNKFFQNIKNEMLKLEVKYDTGYCSNNEKLNYNYFLLNSNNSDNILMERGNNNNTTPVHGMDNFLNKDINIYANINPIVNNISENIFKSPEIKHNTSEISKAKGKNECYEKLQIKKNNSYMNNQNEKTDEQLTYLQNNYVLNENEANKNSLSIIKSQENYYHNSDNIPSCFVNSEDLLTHDSLKYDINPHDQYNININNNLENNSMNRNDINNHLNNNVLNSDNIGNNLLLDDNSNLIVDTNLNSSNNNLLNHNIASSDIVDNSNINENIINFDMINYNKIDDNGINTHLINDNANYYSESSHLLNYNNLKNNLENNIYSNQLIDSKLIDDEVPDNKLLNNEFRDKEDLKINILGDDDLNSCINFHKDNFENFKKSIMEGEACENINNNYYRSKEETNDIKDFTENGIKNKSKCDFSNDENLTEDDVMSKNIIESPSKNFKYMTENMLATEIWKYENNNSKQSDEIKYNENSQKSLNNLAEIKDIENKDKINNVNKIKLKKMLEITDKLIGKKYRGISYDPTRNGWSTFVYKGGVRHKKFFSSFKYGNLLAKKKSIEWRLKNLNPDSHAYAFSLQAKEEFNAILNNDYDEMSNFNDKKKEDNSDNINRDILYINAFLNLFNDEKEKKYSSEESVKIKKSKNNDAKNSFMKKNKKNNNESNCSSSNRKNISMSINYDTNNGCSNDYNDDMNDKGAKDINKNKFLNKKKIYQNKNKKNKKTEDSSSYEYKKHKKKRCADIQNQNFMNKFHLKNNFKSFNDINKLQRDDYMSENLNENESIEQGNNSCNLKEIDQDNDSYLHKKRFSDFLNQKELKSKNSDANENKIKKRTNKKKNNHVNLKIDKKKKKSVKNSKTKELDNNSLSYNYFDETKSHEKMNDQKIKYGNNDKFNNTCLNSADDISSSNFNEMSTNKKNNFFIKYKNQKKRKINVEDKNESMNEINMLDKNDSIDEISLMKENELFEKIYSLCENESVGDDLILQKIEEFCDADSINKNYMSGNSDDTNENNIIDGNYLMENCQYTGKNELTYKNDIEDDNVKNANNMINEDKYFKGNCLMNDNDALTDSETVEEGEIMNELCSLRKSNSEKDNIGTEKVNIRDFMNLIEVNEFLNETKKSNENNKNDIKKDEMNENTCKKRNILNEKEMDYAVENNNEKKIDSYFSVDHDRSSQSVNERNFKYLDELNEGKRKLTVGNKNMNDQNYYIYKDTLLKYMSECTCTNEEEKSVFMKFLNLKTGWILLELNDLEETYHDYFRSKIESFYKTYLSKLKSNSRQNENIRELQIIFEKKLNTPWKHMIFPLYFLYIFNYKIFSILKRTKKKVNSSNDINDKQLKSNLRGINYIKYKKAWCFTYIDIDEKKKKKYFSILEYGFMESKAISILFRKSFVSHLTKMQKFLKNVIFKNKLPTINKLSNYRTIYDYVDYYKKYEEFLVCYGKIIYFNEMKYIYLSTENRQNALNYMPFEVHDKISNDLEPINLITATRNYFSKKSKLLKFPKGIVYLSGYFLWVALFLNKHNKEVIVSFSVRKYSFETAKARCIECYYCLLHKYKFRPINISGVIDLVLESDIECKRYNLLDYSSEELISLDYLFNYFSPSNYVIKNDVVYKKFSYIEKSLHKEYDQMFPNEYVHLDNYQSYEVKGDYLNSEIYMNNVCNFSNNSTNNTSINNIPRIDQNSFEENMDSKICMEKNNYTLNSVKEDNDQNIYEKKFNSNNSCNSSFEYIFNINNDSSNMNTSIYSYDINNEKEENINSYITRNYSNPLNDFPTDQNEKCDKKNIPLYFTDDEKNKTIYRNNTHNEGKNGNFVCSTQNEKEKMKEAKFSNTINLTNKSDINKIKTCKNYDLVNSEHKKDNTFSENSSEEEKNSLINQNNKKFNYSISDSMSHGNFNMLGEDVYDNSTNTNNNNIFNKANQINDNDNDKYTYEEKNNSFEKKRYSEAKEINEDNRNIFHLNGYKTSSINNLVDRENLENKYDSEHFFKKESNFEQKFKSSNKSFLNSDYYKQILNKSIYHFFDNNLQDDYLKKRYDELFNENEVKETLFKKIDKKEEHLGIFMLLNCQWLSDSFVNNIHQIETKYADIYSFENYRNTREEVLKWKCKKNFIKECSEIAKKFPRKVGVHYDSYAHAWVVNCSFNGKRHDKKFLVKTFGFLQARKLAIEHREKWMKIKAYHSMQNLKKKIKNKKK